MTLFLALATLGNTPPLAPIQIKVDANAPTTSVSRSLYGIFFEEINQAGDGGIYAELLRNRGFEGGDANKLPDGWRSVGTGGNLSLDASTVPNDSRRHSLKISRTATAGRFGALNEGFWGVPVQKDERYRLTLWVKGDSPFEVAMEGATGQVLAHTSFSAPGTGWRRIEGVFRSTGSATKGRLAIVPTTAGSVWVAYASLMPVKTWKGRPNGLRMDLAEHIDAMKPGFVRFPGGCYVEGGDRLADAFDWRDSVQPLEKRKGLVHSMWGYSNTNGLGYHEYLQWCEDLGAEPMFVVNCGMSHREITPMAEMGKWVTSALEAVEYATGPVSSKWGAIRAKNGHPKPFKLKYIEIGNENGFSWSNGGSAPYFERYKVMYDALKKAYPNLLYVADVPVPHPTDFVDEHYYMTPRWFWENSTRYDAYDRKGPKIYVGEYAVTQGAGTGNLDAALGEAAFMTGMERNSDVVRLSSYAPLLVNINNRQWNPNAIVFDGTRSYGTPSYWVQALFAQNRADRIVGHTVESVTMSPPPPSGGRIGLQTWRTMAEFKDLQLVVDGKPVDVSRSFTPDGFQARQGTWRASNGILSQTNDGDDRRAVIKGVQIETAKKYSLKVKARKTGGVEGFIVMFDLDGRGEGLQFNLGGWGNTRHAFQRNGQEFGKSVPGHVETGRWYDLEIVRDGARIQALVDGKLVAETEEKGHPDFAAVAGIDDSKHELVIKAVNGSAMARASKLDLSGLKLGKGGTVTVLAGTSLAQENSFENPEAISPKTSKLSTTSSAFDFTFTPYSLTVIRIPMRGKR